MTRVDASTQTSPPSAFVCPITQEIMREPVLLAPSGVTYESSAIHRWLQQSSICPITRRPATVANLVRNRALEEAIQTGVPNAAPLGPEPPAPSVPTPATGAGTAAAPRAAAPRVSTRARPTMAPPAIAAVAPTLMASAANIRAAAATRAAAASVSSAVNLRAATHEIAATVPESGPNATIARAENSIWALEQAARSASYLVQAGYPRYAEHRRRAETDLQSERARLARLQGQ